MTKFSILLRDGNGDPFIISDSFSSVDLAISEIKSIFHGMEFEDDLVEDSIAIIKGVTDYGDEWEFTVVESHSSREWRKIVKDSGVDELD